MQVSVRTLGAKRGPTGLGWGAFTATAMAIVMRAVAAGAASASPAQEHGAGTGDSGARQAAECSFTATGEVEGFVLEPGFQLVLEGVQDDLRVRRVHTVLDRTENVEVASLGEVEVRAVDEKEWVEGRIQVTSTAYYAICSNTGHVYRFGDDTFYHNMDRTVTHEGSWRAGRPETAELPEPTLYAIPKAADGDDGRLKTVQAGHDLVKVEAAPAVHGAKLRNISDRRAREIALAAVPGEVMDLAIERKMGAKRIVVEVIAAADLAETDVIIDMDTGEVLGIEK